MIAFGREVAGRLAVAPGRERLCANGRGRLAAEEARRLEATLAHHRVHRDREAACAFLEPTTRHLTDHGLGRIAEVFDAQAPFRPDGCIPQAWRVAETLRARCEPAPRA